MDRPFHVSRRTAQFVRRQLPNCESFTYSIPSRSRIQKDKGAEGQVSYSGETSIDDRFCKEGSVPTYQTIPEVLSQHVNISDHCPKGFNSLNLAATRKNWRPRHYNHYWRLQRQERLSNSSSRRRILSRSRYHDRYLLFGQGLHASSVCSFAPNGSFSGRLFRTSAAVRPLSLV